MRNESQKGCEWRGSWYIHGKNATADTLFFTVPRSVLQILVVDGKPRRYAMVPAFGIVILPQNHNTENGQAPGQSCILSVRLLQEGGPQRRCRRGSRTYNGQYGNTQYKTCLPATQFCIRKEELQKANQIRFYVGCLIRLRQWHCNRNSYSNCGLRVAKRLVQPIPAYQYKNYYYKSASSECMSSIPIVIPI